MPEPGPRQLWHVPHHSISGAEAMAPIACATVPLLLANWIFVPSGFCMHAQEPAFLRSTCSAKQFCPWWSGTVFLVVLMSSN